MTNKEINIKKIQESSLRAGDEFKSFAHLCRYFDIEPPGGKQRNYLKRLFSCYFEFRYIANSNRIVITDTYFDDPKPYPDKRMGLKNTEYNVPMQDLLIGHKWEVLALYTAREILAEINLVPSKNTKKNTFAQTDYVRKMHRSLESAINQLTIKEKEKIQICISICQVTGTRDKNRGLSYELDDEEKKQYNKIVLDALAKMGYLSKYHVYLNNKQNDFWNRVLEKTREEMGIKDYIYEGYVFTKSEVKKIDNYESIKSELRNLTAMRLCESHEVSYNTKNGKKVPAAIGVKTCHVQYPSKYNEDMEKVLADIVGL